MRPTQPLTRDAAGTLRFEANQIVRALLDTGKLSLDDLSKLGFSQEDREQFYQLIGYSLVGFGELDFISDEAYERAADATSSADGEPASIEGEDHG